jgi:hypothetical protein
MNYTTIILICTIVKELHKLRIFFSIIQFILYFFSDGIPNASNLTSSPQHPPLGGGNGIDSAETAAWEGFLNTNDINSFAIGLGTGAVVSELNPIAFNGFGAGTEWRVQIRPVFANNVVGQYYTLYQCMKLKGTAAAAPLAAAEEVTKELTASEPQDYQIFPWRLSRHKTYLEKLEVCVNA